MLRHDISHKALGHSHFTIFFTHQMMSIKSVRVLSLRPLG